MRQPCRSLRCPGERYRSSHFPRNRRGHLAELWPININDPFQQYYPFVNGCFGVRLERPFGCGYGLFDIGCAAERDRRDRLLGRGIEDDEVAGFSRTDPFAINVEMATVLHTCSQVLGLKTS